MVGEWGRMVGMKRDGTHIVVDALQSSLSLQSRSTMHSTFESAEARLLCDRALTQTGDEDRSLASLAFIEVFG